MKITSLQMNARLMTVEIITALEISIFSNTNIIIYLGKNH